MKIPTGSSKGMSAEEAAGADYDRESFYWEVTQACFASVERRKSTYDLMKHYFLYGGPPEEPAAPFNKIYPHVDTLTSFLFSADSTRFGCHLPKTVPDAEWDKVAAANEMINEEWIDSGGDNVFSQALLWAMCKASTIVKLNVREGRPHPYMVEPECFGVYREDVPGLDRQEAMAHRYYITRSQLENELAAHPSRAKILASLAAKPMRQADSMPESLKRIIVTNSSGMPPISPGGTIRGNSSAINDGQVDYTPVMAVDVIEMTELWLWDDDLADYRVVTRAEDAITIYDRQNFFLPSVKDADGKVTQRGDHPFIKVCPQPMNGYFWGSSEVAQLVGLQQWRNERVNQIRDLLAKQVNPPTVLFGMFGAVDELDFALNKAGGVLPSQDQMGKVQREKPDVPMDLWKDIDNIDTMFNEASGLQNLLQGKGESGVRSGRQTSELARLGSARIKKRALIIEDNLSALATKYFKVMRKYGSDRLTTQPVMGGKSMPFILAQMPHDTQIQVDAHSNSPIFVEDNRALYFDLFERKAIDRESLLEGVDPPKRVLLTRKLKTIELKEAEAAKQQAMAGAQGKKPG
jgi:hypothetical protein